MPSVCLIPLALALAASCAAAGTPGRAATPEDLGPSEIDVSSYPEEYRRIYREVLLPLAPFAGGAARIINAPILELDPLLEQAERRRHPELFADSGVAEVSRDGWRRYVTSLKNRPPCCGACPVLSTRSARELWRFLVYDSIRRKTGDQAPAWARHRRELLARHARGEPAPLALKDSIPTSLTEDRP